MNLASRDPIIDYKSIEELEASIVQKHEARGIPRSMTAANVRYMSDVEYENGEAIGHPIHDLVGLKFSRFGRNANCLCAAIFSNEDRSIFQAKLNQRLYDFKKGKHSKAYRSPKGNGSILGKPSITLECWRAIAAKNNLPVSAPWDRADQEFEGFGKNPYSWSDTLPENTIVPDFWGYVEENPAIEVWITEGWDKALTLLCHGRVAVSVYGSTSGYRTKDLPRPALIPDLKDLAQKGRSFVICLDQDQDTLKSGVDSGTCKMSKLLEDIKCSVSIALWDGSDGKGIDDVIAAQLTNRAYRPNRATEWLDGVRSAAVSFKAWKTDFRKQIILSQIELATKLTIEPERVTKSDYLPELPVYRSFEKCEKDQGQEIIVITSPTGTGKTKALKPLVRELPTIGISPTNATGKQTASDKEDRWNLPHRHDYENGRDQRSVFCADVSRRGGFVACFPSIQVTPRWMLESPYQIVLDEATQVIQDICSGKTSGQKHVENLEFLALVLSNPNCKRIILSEAIVTPAALEFIQALSGIQKTRYFKHEGNAQPYPVTLLDGVANTRYGLMPVDSPSGYWQRFFSSASDKNLILVTASQTRGEAVERVHNAMYPGKKVLRLDSTTNEAGEFDLLLRDPDEYFRQHGIPDLLILSPSAKSGLSITIPGFHEVWGYFYNLSTNDHLQLLGRYRPSVPRFVYCPSQIQQSRDEEFFNRSSIIKRFKDTQRGLQGVYGIDDLLCDDSSEDIASRLKLEEAVLQFQASSIAVIGAQKRIARFALEHELRAAGNTITSIDVLTHNPTKELLKDAQDAIWREEAAAIAEDRPDPSLHTEKWARAKLANESTRSERRTAHKVLWRIEFPGVTFDDAEVCYQALMLDYGAQKKGVLLHASAENLPSTKEANEAGIRATIGGRIRTPHNVPSALGKAKAIAATGILNLIEELRLEPEYTARHPIAVTVAESAKRWAGELKYWLRLSFTEKAGVNDVVNGLLRKLALDPQRVQIGSRFNEKTGEEIPTYKRETQAEAGYDAEGKPLDRKWFYHVPGLNDPIRCQLFEAAQRKLAAMTAQAAAPAASVEVEPEFVPAPEPVTPIAPTHPAADGAIGVGAVVRYGSTLVNWVVEGIDGAIAHIFSAAIAATGYGGRLSVDVGKLKLGAWEAIA